MDSNNTGIRYTDEDWKLKIGEFPKVVKYEREGEKKDYSDAEYFLHNGEIWIPKGLLKNPYLVLKTILLAIAKLTEKKDLEGKEYLARLEKVLPELI